MSKEARTFNELKKEKSFEELNRFAKEVTELYAKSDFVYSQISVARDNNLTVKGLRELMDYAIVMSLVSLGDAQKVVNKTIANQQRKEPDAGATSYSHHKELISKRIKYIVGSYQQDEIRKIATDVAEDFSKPILYFAKKYEIESDTIVKMLLERAIAENIVSDEIVDRLIERTLKNDKSEKTRRYFDNLLKTRKASN